MYRAGICVLAALVAAADLRAADVEKSPAIGAGGAHVVIVPIKSEIGSPALFILRRGLKEAERQKADLVVLDISTPGGALDVTFDMMEALGKFSGKTIAFVDNEAMSAGAFVSAATDEIWFTPTGVIGAAAPVQETGQDIDATMKQKLVSYLKARIRATTEGKGYRAQVVSAMIDSDYELKIDDKVLKTKGELLSLTAAEASKPYGDPPQALLASGVARSIDDLLTQKFGAGKFESRELTATWSEGLAVVLTRLSPILLGLGMLLLFIEFKTPGFGVFGIGGIALLALVFLSSYVAGLSGHEPLLLFGIGVVFVMLELVFWHSAGFLGAAGVAAMLASLLWTMADLWPNEPISVAWSANAFVTPLINMGLGIGIAVVVFAAIARFLPHGWIWDRMVVQSVVGSAAQAAGGTAAAEPELASLVGRHGIATTALRPAGQVQIGERRYEAKVAVGTLDSGTEVVVTGSSDFALTVEKAGA